MEEPRDIELEEPRLALSHEIKQMATEHGLTDEDRARAESIRAQFIEQAHLLQQFKTDYLKLYEKIDLEKSEPASSQFKIAIALESAALLLDAGMIDDPLKELYDARTMIDNEEPENFEKIDGLYKQVKQLIIE